MDTIARTRPGLQLRRQHNDRGWSAAFSLAEPAALSLQQSSSEDSLYLMLHDLNGDTLEERWHASLAEAVEAATREFVLRPNDWVYTPGWRERLRAMPR